MTTVLAGAAMVPVRLFGRAIRRNQCLVTSAGKVARSQSAIYSTVTFLVACVSGVLNAIDRYSQLAYLLKACRNVRSIGIRPCVVCIGREEAYALQFRPAPSGSWWKLLPGAICADARYVVDDHDID